MLLYCRKKRSSSNSRSKAKAAPKVSKLQSQAEKDSIKASAEKSYNDRVSIDSTLLIILAL
jgi:hypothetical protein